MENAQEAAQAAATTEEPAVDTPVAASPDVAEHATNSANEVEPMWYAPTPLTATVPVVRKKRTRLAVAQPDVPAGSINPPAPESTEMQKDESSATLDSVQMPAAMPAKGKVRVLAKPMTKPAAPAPVRRTEIEAAPAAPAISPTAAPATAPAIQETPVAVKAVRNHGRKR